MSSVISYASGPATVTATGVERIPKFTGMIRYVATDGSDASTGLSPDVPKATILAAIAASAAGDAIITKAGTYDEDGLDMNLAGLELWCEAGTILVNSVGSVVLTASSLAYVVRGAHFVQAGAVGFQTTGIGGILDECIAVGCTIGFDIDEHSTQLNLCTAAACTVTQFDIGERNTTLRNCLAPGNGGATRGFYLSASGVTRCTLDNCHSVGNATAGFECVSGTFNNNFPHSTSGGGDGNTVDDGSFNNWPGYIDQLATEQHEDIYPISDGQGTAGDPVTIDNTTVGGSAQNYWGDIARVIPPNVLTARWKFIGIYIHATTGVDIQQWEILFTYASNVSAQNGGNDWDAAETALTVADGSLFEDDDMVWITGNDRVEGEIMLVSGAPAGNVVTLAREITSPVNPGLRYSYATGVGNMMYLVKRDGEPLYEGYEGDFSAPNARAHERYQWHEPKQIAPNGGMLMRMLNATDAGDSEFDVRAIYED